MKMHQQGGVANSKGVCAGIDVSKFHLDVCVGTTEQRVPNDTDGWSALTAMLQCAKVDLVVVEATGGYERGVVCALQSAGVCVARVNPRQARDFAKAMGVLAKTDRVDARVLRDFAGALSRHAERHKHITSMAEPARQVLTELMTRRRQLVDMRVAEHNRLEHAGPQAKRSIASVLKMLDKQIGAIDAQIDDHMDQHLGRQIRSPSCPLHGCDRGHAAQRGDQNVLRALGCRRQAEEGGHRCLHA
jgi:transposase